MSPTCNSLPAVYVRGGTSRAVLFRKDDLPSDQTTWKRIFQAVLGSPDPAGNQLDGLGGGITSLSKIAVLSPSERCGVDVDYFFVQIDPKTGAMLLSANCGNISSAVGPFAVDEGWVEPSKASAGVRIFNENTEKIITSRFDVEASPASYIQIAGVAGYAAPVELTFEEPGGSMASATFPTQNRIDSIKVSDHLMLEATLIDVTIPCVVLDAHQFGLTGRETYASLCSRQDIVDSIEDVRVCAALRMGLAGTDREAREELLNVPDVVLVSRPIGAEHGINARFFSCGRPHRAAPVTSAMALAAAACVQGTVASRLAVRRNSNTVAIHHASGTLEAAADVDHNSGYVISTSVLRTTRRIMEGNVLLPR